MSKAVDEPEVSLPPRERVYKNDGNPAVIELIDRNCRRVLDVGCGAGDNAALVQLRIPECQVFGITHSAAEAKAAEPYLAKCWVVDIEGEFPRDLTEQTFDVIIFSHVLEHLRNPELVVAKFSQMLRKRGYVLIAVPNIACSAMRLKFLLGDFRYEPAGLMDDTHLRFYTYFTADQYLLAKSPDLKLIHKSGAGHFPLPLLRRYVLPSKWARSLDQWAIRHWPNLFGWQTLMKAEKQ